MSLGHPDTWPEALRTLVDVMLGSAQPMFLAWGPERNMLYNDGYAPICGTRHPGALGRPFCDIWPDIMDAVGPILDRTYAGEPAQMDDIALVINRHGYPEETHFAFSYTPVRNRQGAVVGTLCVCTETTARVIAERRHAFLLALEERLRGLADPREITAAAAETLGRHLGASCAGYSEVDAPDDRIVIERDWTAPGAAGAVGTHPLEGFGIPMAAELRAGRTVAVEDSATDPLTSGTERAFAAIRTRAFVGAPLVKGGRLQATMYVLNEVPRTWREFEVKLVTEVAGRTCAAVERARVEIALRESETRLRLAQEASGLGVFERNLVTGRAVWSVANFRLWGLEPDHRAEAPSLDDYQALIVPEDRISHCDARITEQADPTVLHFASEFRIRRADTGEVRWLASRGEYVRNEAGLALILRGINQDVTDRKTAEERQTLLAREVDHRAKNALAVVQSVVHLTPAQEPVAFRRAIEGRISALARAQTLLAGDRWRGADLHGLLKGEIAVFRSDGQRVTLDGPTLMFPAGAAQPMAMAVHELATNAVKHGALSVPGGSVAVAWHVEHGSPDRLHLRWAETGGPPVTGKPQRRGFGTRVLQGTVASQLGGSVEVDWRSDGVVCTLGVPLRGAPTPPEGPGRRGGTLMQHRRPRLAGRRRSVGPKPGSGPVSD